MAGETRVCRCADSGAEAEAVLDGILAKISREPLVCSDFSETIRSLDKAQDCLFAQVYISTHPYFPPTGKICAGTLNFPLKNEHYATEEEPGCALKVPGA